MNPRGALRALDTALVCAIGGRKEYRKFPVIFAVTVTIMMLMLWPLLALACMLLQYEQQQEK